MSARLHGRQAERAAFRARVAAEAEALMAAGATRGAAIRTAAREHRVSPNTVRRWLGRLEADPEAARTAALGDRPRPGRPATVWSRPGADDAWELWSADYLRPEAPTAEECRRRIERHGAAQSPPWTPPPAKAFLRRLRAEAAPAEIARMRGGRVAAERLFPAQQRTVADLAPMEWVNGDGRRHDVFVRLPDGAEGRPVVWYWQDVRTRRLLAYRAGISESSDLVRLSFHELSRWGIPDQVLVDNTHAVSAACLSHERRRFAGSGPQDAYGIWDLLGITVHRTGIVTEVNGRGVGRGQAKPVERAFRDLAESVDKEPRLAGCYAGRSPERKPANHGMRTAPWDLFLEVLADVVAAHNAQSGRRTEAAAGRSFDDAWRAEYPDARPRRATAAQRALLLLAAETTVVKPDGTFHLAAGTGAGVPRSRYWHEDLCAHAGATVVARYDPDDLHGSVVVHDVEGRHLCDAECVLPVGFADRDAAREHNRRRRRRMRALDAADRERTRIDEALERMGPAPTPPAPEPEAPRVVRAVQAPGATEAELDELRARLGRGLAGGAAS